MTEHGRIATHVNGRVGHLTIDNVQRRNALTLAMWQAIPPALAELLAHPAVRVIVLAGAGEQAFTAGADISEFEQQRAGTEQSAAYNAAVTAANEAIERVPRPTIAMIRGACYGGGTGLALSCDLRIAGDDARIAITAARLGIGYPYSALRRLTHLIGPAAAKDLMYTGDAWGAEEALRSGLVNRVVPTAELASFTTAYAGRIAANAPLTLAAAKRGIDEALATHPDLAACAAAEAACAASADYVEGRRAFVEKRKPVFRGL